MKNTRKFLKEQKIVSINSKIKKPFKKIFKESKNISNEEQKMIDIRLKNRIQESRVDNIEIYKA